MQQTVKNGNALNKRTGAEKVLFTIVFLFFCIYALMLIYPVLWGFMSSFKTIDDYFDNRFGIPTQWMFDNYSQAIDIIQDKGTGMTFLQMAWNSIWFSVGSAWINMEFISAYAYVLNKYKFKGRDFLYGLCLFGVNLRVIAIYQQMERLYESVVVFA